MTRDILTIARRYHELGLNVIPTADDKRPVHVGAGRLAWDKWQDARQTAEDLAGLPWEKATGLAAVCGPVSRALVCLDFDGGQDLGPVRAALAALGLPADYGWLVCTPSGAYHVWTLCPGLVLPEGKGRLDRPARAGFDHVELRYHGHYALLPPSLDGRYHGLAGDLPQDAPAEVTPAALLMAYDLVTAAPASSLGAPTATPAKVHTAPAGRYSPYAQAALDRELDELARTHEGARNAQLNRAAYSLSQLVAGGELDRADVESQLAATALAIGLEERETMRTLRSAFDAGAKTPRNVPAPTWPAASSPSAPSEIQAPGSPGQNGGDPARSVDVPDLETREDLTELGNARRLVRLYGRNLRYVEAWGWLVWDGKRWTKDETGAVMRLAKRVALSFYQDAATHLEKATEATRQAEAASAAGAEEAHKAAIEKAEQERKLSKIMTDHAKRCQSNSQLENMVKLAGSEKSIAARAEDFDQDPWLLNAANGIIDLRTGDLKPHDRAALCTKLAPAEYDPAAGCPRWLVFLDRIFAGDASLIGFVQRLIGYSLTGSTRDHVLPFCHGTGANGKSTLTGTLSEMLGDYAQKARRSLVTLGRGSDDGGPTPDKARLKGARFVVVNETEEGRRLAEADVKDLTGSDRITAAYKYKDPFEFDPSHTLWLYGNHRPDIRGRDEGIWRRVKYIPFEVVIPEAERDATLLDKLRGELPGILAWAVKGCLDWQRAGLQEPEKVRQATKAYREEMDSFAAFIGDCCIEGDSYQVDSHDLYQAYKTWCDESGLRPESQKRLAAPLRDRGYSDKDGKGDKLRDPKTRRVVWRGLALIDAPRQESLLNPNPSNPSNPRIGSGPIESQESHPTHFQKMDSMDSMDSQMAYEEGEL